MWHVRFGGGQPPGGLTPVFGWLSARVGGEGEEGFRKGFPGNRLENPDRPPRRLTGVD